MKELYHISFNGNLQGLWTPQLPDGMDSNTVGQYSEPLIPRISTAPTLLQCFQAIYPNISPFFEEDNYPWLEFYVYRPIITGCERILTPNDLTDNNYVHDAHMTEEHSIIDPVFMRLIQKIKIDNTNNIKFLSHHPFNNKSNQKIGFAPASARISTIKSY